MSPIKRALPGWYNIRHPALSFLVMGWPTRCSRDTAKVAVFRLASSHPDRSAGIYPAKTCYDCFLSDSSRWKYCINLSDARMQGSSMVKHPMMVRLGSSVDAYSKNREKCITSGTIAIAMRGGPIGCAWNLTSRDLNKNSMVV